MKQTQEIKELTFSAYVIKGNRQVTRREVIASKRFRLGDETYIIKPECIYLMNIDGVLRSVSYYREGNPNPFDFFLPHNHGIKEKELDELFAEDFFFIVSDIRPDNKMRYVLWLSIINLIVVLTMVSVAGISALIG